MDPKVSVITVCYNAEKFIENAINSVLDQTYKNIEYIVIDGNSTDDTILIINKYKDKISYFLSEPDNGMYEAMNKGIKAASGEIFYFLNSDDVFHDKYVVENTVRLFEENVETELIYGDMLILNPNTKATSLKTVENVTRLFFFKNSIAQQVIFYKKSAFDKAGLFDEKYKIVGDYEFVLRAFYKYNIKRRYVPQVMAIYRDGGMSNSEKYFKLQKKERNDAILRYYSKLEYYKYKQFPKVIDKIRIMIVNFAAKFS